MRSRPSGRAVLALALVAVACRGVTTAASTFVRDAEPQPDAATAPDASVPDASDAASPVTRDAIGPYELPLLPPDRTVWYALPWSPDEHRLIGHLHGQCAPPVYSCGQWIDAGAERGLLVCPTGNERCGSATGPAMWDESFTLMDQDLERGVQIVDKRLGDGGIDRRGAILTGFSRGGWAAIELVGMHPGRWPLLILIEADVTIRAEYLRRSKVRAVVMVAASQGTELPGMKKSVEALVAEGFPAELLFMPKTGHMYSTDIEEVMRQAFAFVIDNGRDAGLP